MVRLLLILAKLYLFFYIYSGISCTQNKNINLCQNYKHICKQFKHFYKTKNKLHFIQTETIFYFLKKTFTDIFHINIFCPTSSLQPVLSDI